MKVNMTPNPLDVVTIHASQGDTEARQWEFELHNNGELIDTSDVTEQMFFKAYEGGTEQILPENGSTPTTSPFLGDIRYPQGLLTDQEFTYRQSPTEEDGLAKITDIKGNTLVWNQLLQNGNFESTDGYYPGNASFSVANNEGSITLQGDNSYLYRNANFVVGHKLLIMADALTDNENGAYIYLTYPVANGGPHYTLTRQYQRCMDIIEVASGRNTYLQYTIRGGINGQLVKFKNWTVFDLTKMGLDSITDPSDFTSLFPLPYYAYNQGTLLSFNGNGIKTVGKNLVNPDDFVQGLINWQTGELNTNVQWITSPFISVFDSTYVTVQGWKDGTEENFMVRFTEYDSSYNVVANINNINVSSVAHYQRKVTLNANTKYIRFSCGFNNKTTTPQTFFAVNRVMLEFGGTASSYESYKEDTLSLPISTYFPTGMKSGGPTYDEMTNSKYVIRTKYIKFDGSQPWSTRTTSGGSVLYEFVPPDIKNVGTQATAQISNNIYPWNTNLSENKTIRQVNTTISVRRDGITSLQAWYSELANNPLEVVYQLATPTETTFTTASLVTENGEIPLSNEDGVLIGKCTEQLSSESGFFDAKIKLADEDGECYSNKIQLHVERSPQ